jgi:segregation and condensation protein B
MNTELVTDQTQIKQVLEAVIFAAPKAMSYVRLKNLLTHFNFDVENLKDILQQMIDESQNRGFQMVQVAGGYQYRSHPEHAEVLQKLLEDRPTKLGASALEVLSIVAYKQPITRSEIDSVRGVDSGHLMRGLLEKNLVRTQGHAETPGRPLLYGTAPYFLEIFGLNSLDDLPAMDELARELLLKEGEGELNIDSSGLSAEPERGDYDEAPVEVVEKADFGVEERAREELAQST